MTPGEDGQILVEVTAGTARLVWRGYVLAEAPITEGADDDAVAVVLARLFTHPVPPLLGPEPAPRPGPVLPPT